MSREWRDKYQEEQKSSEKLVAASQNPEREYLTSILFPLHEVIIARHLSTGTRNSTRVPPAALGSISTSPPKARARSRIFPNPWPKWA
jgi:hypothetical protein